MVLDTGTSECVTSAPSSRRQPLRVPDLGQLSVSVGIDRSVVICGLGLAVVTLGSSRNHVSTGS